MRIAFVAPLVTPIAEPHLGGSQALLADLAAGLVQRGHAVTVFARAGSRVPGVEVVEIEVDDAAMATTLFRPGVGPGAPTAGSVAAFQHSWRMVSAGGFEVAHNHAFDVPAITEACYADVPVVHTLHLPADRTVAEALEGTPSTVACVSESQARGWRALVEVHSVLANGVPVARIPWSPDPGRVALFAGRFSPEKGAADAIRVARRAGVPLVVVGSAYDEAYAAEVRELAEECGTEVREPLTRPALWELMASSLALVCPVGWDEPFGLAAAEAQAAGTPVVAFARGGLTEVVSDGSTGALVPGGDLDAAATALRSAGRFDRVACRRHAEAVLDIERTLDAHERLYAKLVSG